MSPHVSTHHDSTPSNDWDVYAYALNELPPQAKLHFEERLANDPQLCEEFLAALKLLCALRSISPAPVIPARSLPSSSGHNSGRRVSSAVAPAALAATVLFAASCVYMVKRPQPDSLSEAVALSNILQTPEITTGTPIDAYPQLLSPSELPETPDWLLTAIDLDEQPSASDITPVEDEEAVF